MGLLLGIVTALWAGQTASQALYREVDERLNDAGARANVSLRLLERDHLALVRSIAFTQGVPESLVAANVEHLQQLAAPLQASADVPIVNLVDTEGTIVLAIRSEGAPPPLTREISWDVVGRALQGESDSYGERWTALVHAVEGDLLATAGPVRVGDHIVGAVVVATPLDEALEMMAGETPILLTVYDIDGIPIASWNDSLPPSIDASLAANIVGGRGEPVPRSYSFGRENRRELLGRLILRNEAVAVLGVATPESVGHVTQSITLQVLVGTGATVLALGTLLGRWLQGRALS